MRYIYLLLFGACFLFSNSLSQIKQNGTLRVGVSSTNPPFAKFDNNEFVGFEINLAKILANEIGSSVKTEFVPLTAKDRIPFLKNNTVDIVIATFTVTEKRKEDIDFAMPYFATNLGLLSKKDHRVGSLNDVKTEPIVLQKGSTAEEFFKTKGANLVYCGKYKECHQMLKDGNATVWANDNIAVLAYAAQDDETEVNVRFGPIEYLAIGVAKGNKELLDFINEEMVKLSKNKFFEEAFHKDIEPYYKGKAEKRYFLLDDLYNVMF